MYDYNDIAFTYILALIQNIVCDSVFINIEVDLKHPMLEFPSSHEFQWMTLVNHCLSSQFDSLGSLWRNPEPSQDSNFDCLSISD